MPSALIVVDVQRDFVDGPLAVPGAQKVVDDIAKFISPTGFDYVVATKDWHRPDSSNGGHFAEWPVHCLADSEGATFANPIKHSMFDTIFYKGWDRPAYSGFEGAAIDPPSISTSLETYLCRRAVTNVFVVGIAYEYCVKATALDSAKLGFVTTVIRPYCARMRNDKQDSLDLERGGVRIIT
jgi:nicotinamidase/pyrazinamidase